MQAEDRHYLDARSRQPDQRSKAEVSLEHVGKAMRMERYLSRRQADVGQA